MFFFLFFSFCFFFFSSRRRHTRLQGDWSSDVCSSDLFSIRRLEVHGKDQVSPQCQWQRGQCLAQLKRKAPDVDLRSEERRVGKESRSRGSPGREQRRENCKE